MQIKLTSRKVIRYPLHRYGTDWVPLISTIEIVHTSQRNKTDLEKAFDYCTEKEIPCGKCYLGYQALDKHKSAVFVVSRKIKV
jgi:hypothetical protein